MHLYLHVNVIDERAPAAAFRAGRLEAQRGPTENIHVSNLWSMDRICGRILERAMRHPISGNPGLGVLHLICHGNAGVVHLGNGLTAATANSFRHLRGFFVGQYPRIEVHACGVLSGTSVSGAVPIGTIDHNAPGHALMQALSNAAQVLVIAAYNIQFPDSGMVFEGPIRHFRPILR